LLFQQNEILNSHEGLDEEIDEFNGY